MAPATLEPPRPRIVPVRACSRCDAVDDVFHLTMVGKRWLCRRCHGALRFSGVRDAEPPEPATARLRRADRVLRWTAVGLRIAAYAAFLAFAAAYPLAENLLLGVFAADLFGWMLHAWSDARFHGRAVTAEAVLYTLLFFGMQASGRLALPLDVEARFLAAGAAALTLGAHWVRFWVKLRVQPF